MSFHLRPAITTEAKPLIGLYSESGNGKTKSALLLAKGFSPDMAKVAMIETESGRGEVYAGDPTVGGYQVLSIRESFSPREYHAALAEVEKAGMRVVIIDSASHEWEGAGGVLGMAAKNQGEGKKGVLVWQQPKMDHQREFVLPLLQTPISLVIVCMRAKYPMKETVKDGKKDWIRSEILEPKQSEDILYEMMVHGWIDSQHRLHVTKYTTDDFKAIFVDNYPVTVDTGKRLAQWAAGGTKPKTESPKPEEPPSEDAPPTPEEEQVALRERGMIPGDREQEIGGYLLGINRFSNAQELSKWFSELKKREKFNEKEMATLSKAVTEKMAKLIKK